MTDSHVAQPPRSAGSGQASAVDRAHAPSTSSGQAVRPYERRPSAALFAAPAGDLGGAFPTFRGLPRRTGRLWRKTWRPLAILVGLLVVAHLVLNVIASRRLGAELARLRAQGAPLTMLEAAPPKVPDSQNAAVLYQKAFKGLGNDDKWVVRRFLYRYPMRIRGELLPPPTLAEVEAVLARHEGDFRLLREGSLRPACRFPVKWEAGFEALFPHLAGVRHATRFLTAKAVVDARRGRSGEALDDLAIAIRISNHISAEPTLISQLVRVACIAIVSARLPDVLAAAPPTAQQGRAFYDLLGREDLTGAWTHGMEGERAGGLWAFDYVRRKGPQVIASMSDPRARVRGLARVWPVARIVWSPFLKLDEVQYLRRMQYVIALSREPYREILPRLEALESPPRTKSLPFYAIMTRILSPVWARATEARDKGIALIGLMQAALALRAYQIEHGTYPASLDQLRAAGGWAIPDDPFSGKPFIYRRDPRGYLIYSVGPDFADNGGIDRETAQRRQQYRLGTVPREVKYDLPLRMTR